MVVVGKYKKIKFKYSKVKFIGWIDMEELFFKGLICILIVDFFLENDVISVMESLYEMGFDCVYIVKY